MQRIPAIAAMLAALTAAHLSGGGWFIISLGQPGAHSDPRAHSSAFVVRVYGCSAMQAEVVATAEGIVNGRRQSIPLRPIRLTGGRDTVLFAEGSRFVEDWSSYSVAIPRDWPAEGKWIVKVTAQTSWYWQSALVALAPEGGVDWGRSRLGSLFGDSQVTAALNAPAPTLAGGH